MLGGHSADTDRCMAVLEVTSYEPHHEKTFLMPYANNKSADQPVHPHSLISTFVFGSLDSMIPAVAMNEILRR